MTEAKVPPDTVLVTINCLEDMANRIDAASAMLAALQLAMPHLAIAKGRGEGVAYDAAWTAMRAAENAGIKAKG